MAISLVVAYLQYYTSALVAACETELLPCFMAIAMPEL
jgi:hypothetical protein